MIVPDWIVMFCFKCGTESEIPREKAIITLDLVKNRTTYEAYCPKCKEEILYSRKNNG